MSRSIEDAPREKKPEKKSSSSKIFGKCFPRHHYGKELATGGEFPPTIVVKICEVCGKREEKEGYFY